MNPRLRLTLGVIAAILVGICGMCALLGVFGALTPDLPTGR